MPLSEVLATLWLDRWALAISPPLLSHTNPPTVLILLLASEHWNTGTLRCRKHPHDAYHSRLRGPGRDQSALGTIARRNTGTLLLSGKTPMTLTSRSRARPLMLWEHRNRASPEVIELKRRSYWERKESLPIVASEAFLCLLYRAQSREAAATCCSLWSAQGATVL